MKCKSLDEFIGAFCTRGPETFKVPSKPDLPAGVIYHGSAGFGDSFTVSSRIPEGFRDVEAWSDGFRTVWVNEDMRSIVTYCEGDVDVTIDRSKDVFDARIISAHDFYANH